MTTSQALVNEMSKLQTEREEAEKQRALIDAIWAKPVPGPATWPGGYWAKSGPGSHERGSWMMN